MNALKTRLLSRPVVVTRHSIKRAHERLGWSRAALSRMAFRAVEKGIEMDALPNPDRFALRSASSSESADWVVSYRGVYYIFVREAGNTVLKTVLNSACL